MHSLLLIAYVHPRIFYHWSSWYELAGHAPVFSSDLFSSLKFISLAHDSNNLSGQSRVQRSSSGIRKTYHISLSFVFIQCLVWCRTLLSSKIWVVIQTSSHPWCRRTLIKLLFHNFVTSYWQLFLTLAGYLNPRIRINRHFANLVLVQMRPHCEHILLRTVALSKTNTIVYDLRFLPLNCSSGLLFSAADESTVLFRRWWPQLYAVFQVWLHYSLARRVKYPFGARIHVTLTHQLKAHYYAPL